MQQYHLIDAPSPAAVAASYETLLRAADSLRALLTRDHDPDWYGRQPFFRPGVSRTAVHHAAIDIMTSRPPDEVLITGETEHYLQRWHIVRDPARGHVYLHRFLRSDDRDRGLHCHPWDHVSWLLFGSYIELWDTHRTSPAKRISECARSRHSTGEVIWRRAEVRHLFELPAAGELPITLFVTGPRTRDWGFWPDGLFTPFHDPDSHSRTTGTSPSGAAGLSA